MDATGDVLAAVLNDEVRHALDVAGRPLGEQASAGSYAASERWERACPFSDGRRSANKPINAAALAQVGRCWPDLLQCLGARVAAYVPVGRLPSLHQAWCACSDATLLAAHEHLSPGAAGRPIPEVLSALYKTTLGFSDVLPALLVAGRVAPGDPLVDAYSPDAFFELLDQEGWLIGTQQVCAGSRPMILEAYRTLCRAPATPATTTTASFDAFAEACRELFLLAAMMVAAAREVVARGGLGEVPGFGDRPDRVPFEAWPTCARLLQTSRARYVRLVRSRPSVGPADVARLYTRGGLPESVAVFAQARAQTTLGPLRAIDQAFVHSAQPALATLMQSLGYANAPLLERSHLKPLHALGD